MQLFDGKPFGLEHRGHGPLLLAGMVTLAYLTSFYGAFQFDDYNVIVNNDTVHSFSVWLHDLPRGIRPLLKLSYVFNWVSGAGLPGFHLVNFAIHLVNVFFVYQLTLKVAGNDLERPAVAAFIGAGIFALHPLQTEAVTYLCGRSASLATTFYLGGILAHVRGRDAETGFSFRLLPPLLFIAAMLTKETAVTLPFALLLWEIVRGEVRTGVRAALRTQWLYWLILLFFVVALLVHPRYGSLLEYSFDIRGWRQNLLNQVNGVWYLLSRLFILNGMNIDPDLPPVTAVDVMLIGKAALLSSLAAIGLVTLRRLPWLGFGIFWLFLHLVPTNSFVPRLDLVNDRQAYLPLAGLAATAGCAATAILSRWSKRLAGIAVLLIFVTLAGFTASRNHAFRSEISLWEDAAEKSPRKPRVFNNLGYAYSQAGRSEEACLAYRKAVTLDPAYLLARNNLASFCRSP